MQKLKKCKQFLTMSQFHVNLFIFLEEYDIISSYFCRILPFPMLCYRVEKAMMPLASEMTPVLVKVTPENWDQGK